jgi:hypothetical protein
LKLGFPRRSAAPPTGNIRGLWLIEHSTTILSVTPVADIREGHAEACGSVPMGVPVLAVISLFMRVIVIERAVCAHWEHGGQPEAP